MSAEYPNAFSVKFDKDVHIQYQQNGSVLRGKVGEKTLVGSEAAWLPQIEPIASNTSYVRAASTAHIDTTHVSRKLESTKIYWADLIDIHDKNRSVAEFLGPYAANAAKYFGQQLDTTILTNSVGNNTIKDGTAAESTVALPASQQVAVDFEVAMTNTGLTLAKLIEAKSILGQNETPLGERKYLVHRQEQIDDLLNNVDQVRNADYAAVKALVEGEVNRFLGFDFVKTQTVAVDGSDIASAVAYTKSALVAGITEDFNAKVTQESTLNFSWQVWATHDVGATRTQEEGVVEVLCDQSP